MYIYSKGVVPLCHVSCKLLLLPVQQTLGSCGEFMACRVKGEYLKADAPRTDSHLNQANNEQFGGIWTAMPVEATGCTQLSLRPFVASGTARKTSVVPRKTLPSPAFLAPDPSAACDLGGSVSRSCSACLSFFFFPHLVLSLPLSV